MFHIMLFQLSSPNGQVVTKACPNATSWWGLRSSIFASSWGRSPSPPRVRVSLEVDRPHGKAIAKCGYPRMYSIRRLLAACSWKSGLQGASASGLPVAIATCPWKSRPHSEGRLASVWCRTRWSGMTAWSAGPTRFQWMQVLVNGSFRRPHYWTIFPSKCFAATSSGGKNSRNDQRITLARSKSLSAGQDP